jgi:peptidoglycan/LPS O-acetylase OafA/YrhL
MTHPAAADRSYRPDIDGIRAIAILSVVLYHAGVPCISGGFTGVDIFFVISGYLIGGHIFSEIRSGTFSFMRFYQRRAKRILPAFYVVLAFTILAAMFLLSPFEAFAFGRSAVAATLSLSNIFFWHSTDYFDPAGNLHPLLMTWSLGVEEQFYAVIPLLMVLLSRIRRSLLLPAILAVCTLSFLLAWCELGTHPANVFYLLPERAWELGLGVTLAVTELTRGPLSLPAGLVHLPSSIGLILMFAPMFLLNANSPFPGPAALPSVLGTALIIAFPAGWINRRLFSLPLLVFIGRVSYSWYLWHWPVLSYLHIASSKLPPTAVVTAIAFSLAAAILSYYLVEQPFRRSNRPPGPLLIRYALVSALMLSVCAATWLNGGFPQRYPELATADRAARIWTTHPCLAQDGKLDLSSQCYDSSDPRPSVALWGDSHSAALAPGLRSAANAQGYGFVQLGHAGCLPLNGAAYYFAEAPPRARQCLEFSSQAMTLLRNDRHVSIVVLNAMWANAFRGTHGDGWLLAGSAHEVTTLDANAASSVFRRALAASIQSLREAGKQVLVIEDVPRFDFDSMRRFRTDHIPARRALSIWMGAAPADAGIAEFAGATSDAYANNQIRTALDGLDSISLIDLKPALCLNGIECAFREGDRPLYFDYHHLSPDGARYALRGFHFPAPVDQLRQ